LEADAKVVWSKSKFDLPTFYKQLKKEINAGYINPPAQADFEI
jgi:type I restriction enzyme S subunit